LLHYLLLGELPGPAFQNPALALGKHKSVAAPGLLSLGLAEDRQGEAVQVLDDSVSVFYTVDLELQARIQEVLDGYDNPLSAVVLLDPATGRVLAMAEKSVFDDETTRASLRAVGPAASVFKVITAAALLDNGAVDAQRRVCYSGGMNRVLEHHLYFNPDRDKKCRNMAEALASSTNVVFSRLAFEFLTPQDLQDKAERFAFNEALPFLWPVQASPARIPENRLEFARAAAGFYHTEMSPLHAASIMGAIANDGYMMAPQIVDRIEKDGEVVFEGQPSVLHRSCTAQTAATLLDMMSLTTESGTAAKYFKKAAPWLRDMKVAGKTGSLSAPIDGQKYAYSWFVAAAPADNPQVVVAALAVNEPAWKVKGTFLGRRALEEYFRTPATR
jgi:cell division protein FtsI/penicillin-binding protein 2